MDRRRLTGRGGPPRHDGPRPAPDGDDLIFGVHAVEEALAAGDALRRVHVASERRRDPALREVIGRAQERGIELRFEERSFFATLPGRVHQHVVALGEPFAYASLDEILARPRTLPALFVVLDHLTDPHNVGAIVRSAEGAGADAVVLPERRSAGVNATVRKSAAGATSHQPIVRVGNLVNALRTLRDAGVWIAGAAAGEGSVPYDRGDLDRDLALVIGAEGDGLSPVIRKACDFLVEIPLRGRVDSLNASVAAGILVFEARRQQSGTRR